jgi:alanine racemase
MFGYPVWAEIDLDAVAENVRSVRSLIKPSTKLLAVVKANGYGHGSVEVGKAALKNGASWLGVARISEALALRQAGIVAPILVLGYVPPEQADAVVNHGLSQTIYSVEMARDLSDAAVRLGSKAKVHIKVDTGMGRLGIWASAVAVDEILQLARMPHIEVEGIFTHFANADGDEAYTRQQLERFLELLETLRRAGLEVPLRHAANSPALIGLSESHLDMVRAGLIVYGLYPAENMRKGLPHLRPAMSLKARVAYVKKVPAGFKVSYGCTYTTSSPTTIATLPLGYADGYPRSLSGVGEVLIKGRRLPVIGRVCMDQIMVDAGSDPDIFMGDEVVLLGSQGNAAITADEIAGKLNTINYEVVCMINWRVPRLYLN